VYELHFVDDENCDRSLSNRTARRRARYCERETENGKVTRQLKIRNDPKRHSDREDVSQ